MKTRVVFIIVMGSIALTALVVLAIEAHWGTSGAINGGTIAIGGAAVGALATLAGNRDGSVYEDKNYVGVTRPPVIEPPAHGWPDQTTRENEIG